MNEMRMYITKSFYRLFSIVSTVVKNKVLILVHDIFITRGKTSPIFKAQFSTIQFLLRWWPNKKIKSFIKYILLYANKP